MITRDMRTKMRSIISHTFSLQNRHDNEGAENEDGKSLTFSLQNEYDDKGDENEDLQQKKPHLFCTKPG